MPQLLKRGSLFADSCDGFLGACSRCSSILKCDEEDTKTLKRVRFLREPDGEVGAFEADCSECPSKVYIAGFQDPGAEDLEAKAKSFAAFAGEQAHLGRIFR